MRDIQKRIIMLTVEALVLSVEITFLFSTNIHRVLDIRDNVGGYIKEVAISQDTTFFKNSHYSSDDKNLKTIYLEKGTVVCLENSNGLSLFGVYVDDEGFKQEILVDLSQISSFPEVQVYLNELNEINRNRKNEFVRLTMIYDYPFFLIISLVISIIISVIAKKVGKYHVISVIAVMVVIFVFYVIARNISIPV